MKLRDLLVREGARFEVITHPEIYTAAERAAACRVAGRVTAKVVVVQDDEDDWYALAVLPATVQLDVAKLREITGRPRLALANEKAFARLFPDCEIGAVPVFGRLYGGLDVYLERSLADCDELMFEGGSHHEEIRMPMSDYVRIERPDIVPLAMLPRAA